jgi:hypothetical protein
MDLPLPYFTFQEYKRARNFAPKSIQGSSPWQRKWNAKFDKVYNGHEHIKNKVRAT